MKAMQKKTRGLVTIPNVLLVILFILTLLLVQLAMIDGLVLTEQDHYDKYTECIQSDKDEEFCLRKWTK